MHLYKTMSTTNFLRKQDDLQLAKSLNKWIHQGVSQNYKGDPLDKFIQRVI